MNIEWTEKYRPAVVRFLAQFVGADNAEDVFHTTLIEIAQYPEEVRQCIPTGKEQAWLFRACQRDALDFIKTANRKQRAAESPQALSLDVNDVQEPHEYRKSNIARRVRFDPLDPQLDPETAMLLAEKIEQAKSSLSPAEQKVFQAMLDHGSEWEDIAKDLKIHIRTAQNRVYQVRRKLTGLFTR